MKYIQQFSQAIHELQLVRRIAFFWMMWLTTISMFWVFEYVESSPEVTTTTAMIIGAILTPVLTLQGAIINFYAKHPYEIQMRAPIIPLVDDD